MSITPSIAAVPARIRQGISEMGVISSLTLDADLISSAVAAIESVASMTVAPLRIRQGAATIDAVASLSADGDAVLDAITAIAIASSLSINADVIEAVSSVAAIAIAYITQSLGYTGTLDAGDVLEIDTDAMTVKLNGVDARTNFTGTFPHLYEGTNELRWKDEDGTRDLDLEVDHSPRYL